ncbi:DUF6262 family protein [Frankia sp. CiP3]|uniref:DUF6262 family protein n=1 Tax=Frankia sp. CiP3 TaxID=2880971 RepID=UPI001EF5F8DF|nr:DUF6262 family protein [Frankia sp. CiP3]
MTSTTRAQRVETLTRAARAKHDTAVTRAETGIRALATSGEPINFRSVAATAGVSLDFLYRNPDLRHRIETLRAQQHPTRTAPPPRTSATPTDAVVTTLTVKLRQARDEIAELRAQLAAAHGELLTLRRARQPRLDAVVDDALVTDASSTS